MRRLTWIIIAVVVVVAAIVIGIVVANSGGGKIANSNAATPGANTGVSGNVSMMAVWSGQEQTSFEKVIAAFNKLYPNVKVNFTSGGNNLPQILSTAVAGGHPPDIAALPQPGLMKQFVASGALKPIDFAKSVVDKNFSPTVTSIGTVNGHLYGLLFKGANKSTVWYNVQAFKSAGITPPTTWTQLLADAKTLKASGVTPYSIGADVGWPITDLFENIYLRTAGPAMYQKLTTHQIPWTDPSVTTALKDMQQIIGNPSYINGGNGGAATSDFPTSVTNVFTNPPKAAMVFEGDFVESVITSSTSAKPTTGFNYFPFPSINGKGGNYVVAGGDIVTMFKDSPAARAFIDYLATPQAAEVWARLGGFSSPSKNVPASVYTDPIGRRAAVALATAPVAVYDMSDQQPAAFGATTGQGEWQIFTNFLKNPSNISGTEKALEAAATAAYKK
ncbi:MAG: ABC transporter substrate-binding protein [Candidatus Limnocylindrales bacterium]